MNIDLNRTFSMRTQILTGVACGFLELLANSLQKYFNSMPLFIDTLFTITASFFGGISGIISAVMYHFLSKVLYAHTLLSLSWTAVSLTIVLIIRLYVRARREFTAIDIVLLSFIVGIAISAEGALISCILHIFTDYREDMPVRQMYFFLKSNGIPMFICALLPRVPINLLDKGICVPLGFLVYTGARRFIPAQKNNSCETC